MSVPHIDPGSAINLLRLLLDGYKLFSDKFKDKHTPERIEEILVKAEKAQPKTVDASDIEHSITESLDPRDAEVVKSDFELLSLLFFSAPTLDAFDYWGKFSRLVVGLLTYAKKNRLFELRGVKQPEFDEVLFLPRTSKRILPEKCASELCIPDIGQTLESVECFALLRKEGQHFPIVDGVSADFMFNQYSASVRNAQCPYHMKPGQQRHWLKFDRGERNVPQFRQSYEYMLAADDFISLVEALRDDVQEHARTIQADERKIGPLFKAIDAFAQGIAT